jgi:uncharacterized damage-inducible protein DinB
MTTTTLFYDAYTEARTRLDLVVQLIHENDLAKKLGASPNSCGFLMRHIGDVELLFSKNVFKIHGVEVKAQTVIDRKDTGVWNNHVELRSYLDHSFNTVLKAIALQDDQEWTAVIETKEFGKKTKAEAFGRIVSHTAYHAGQLAMIQKYGK